jgi:hypothetical protein
MILSFLEKFQKTRTFSILGHSTVYPGLALKNPPKKTHPKKTKKTHLKKPTKNVFLGFFWVFLIFLFFMKIIQTFLFQTDFL